MIGGQRVTVARTAVERIIELRRAELRPGRPVEAAAFEGDGDAASRHFGAFLGPEVVGCVSLLPSIWRGEPAYRLRGMAVRADLARRGIGGMLLRFAERALSDELGVERLWCNARLHAAPFYEKHGWVIASERFDIPGVGPHYRMCKMPEGLET